MAILSMATVPNRGYENPVAGFKATLNRGHYASLNNLSFRVPNPCTVMFASSHTRFIRRLPRNFRIVCTAASSAGGSSASNNENPYEVLGVSPIERFDVIKASYTKKYKDAEKRGDGAAMAQLERAYDKIMMAQLSNRKRGVTFGSIEVSKDIRYADKQPIVPWGPRYARPGKRDIQINLAISTLLAGWMVYAGSADWKPMEFLIFGYIYRIFQKLKGFEAPVKTLLSEDGEDESRGIRTGKRLLRTLALVFSCIAVSSVAYTGLLNVIELAGFSIPRALINSQGNIGGIEDIFQLHEAGELAKYLEGFPRHTGSIRPCHGCGDSRFVPYLNCDGSRNIFTQKLGGQGHGRIVWLKCPCCNENNIIRCPVCCVDAAFVFPVCSSDAASVKT